MVSAGHCYFWVFKRYLSKLSALNGASLKWPSSRRLPSSASAAPSACIAKRTVLRIPLAIEGPGFPSNYGYYPASSPSATLFSSISELESPFTISVSPSSMIACGTYAFLIGRVAPSDMSKTVFPRHTTWQKMPSPLCGLENRVVCTAVNHWLATLLALTDTSPLLSCYMLSLSLFLNFELLLTSILFWRSNVHPKQRSHNWALRRKTSHRDLVRDIIRSKGTPNSEGGPYLSGNPYLGAINDSNTVVIDSIAHQACLNLWR